MHEILRSHILDRLGSSLPDLDTVLSRFAPRSFRRGAMILQAGEVCRQCLFVVRGCIQVFVYDSEGNEMTRDFAVEESWLVEISSFMQQTPAQENFRAAERTEVLAIGPEDFREMMAQVPPFEQMYRQIMERSYANSVFRLNTFIAMDGLERLRWMIAHQPRLMTRLSSRAIASYLGISPETLSRLKAKL
ncbi:MAG: Crp/Fnr family transcriptional regulator [Bacteroidia bacterium]|nr:Crp/Fnr family transcriptional regulator [Bacteroidia bacterium]